jgi:hypothetical protein
MMEKWNNKFSIVCSLQSVEIKKMKPGVGIQVEWVTIKMH